MKKPVDVIGTGDLLKSLGRSDSVIVDVRPVEAYNGWRLKNESRGGHIRSARCLPCRWKKYIDWIEMVRGKGIFPEHKIIIYGYDEKQILSVAERFICAGYGNVYVYFHFLDEWVEEELLPMEMLPRYRHLAPARWLESLMNGSLVPEMENTRFRVCHVHYRNHEDYLSGHIPGAVSLDTLLIEDPQTWNRRSPAELQKVMQDLGITSDTTVILYGRFSYPDIRDPFPGSSEGILASMRAAFIMLYCGVKDVRVLNGGIHAWEDEGFRLVQKETIPGPVTDFGVSIPQHPEYAVDLEEAKAIIASPDSDLVCVRSRDEFLGNVSGYNYIEKKGRIPGALFIHSGSDAYHTEEYRNLDHTTREYHEIEKLWTNSGLDPQKHNAFYCGTGWRGAEAFFNAWLMGYPKISVYDGGWFEWSSHTELPTETGIPGISSKNINLITHADNN